MKQKIIVSDFDGTITQKDSLYYFFKEYASEEWTIVETLWKERKIGSKECLIREFDLVKNLSAELIDNYIKTLKLDSYFAEFIKEVNDKNIDFIVVSDGIDYFINGILEYNGLKNIGLIANHGEFKGEKFEITCPKSYSGCHVNSGVCKCKVINDLKKEYKELIYIGDGTSDFCAVENAKTDKLFAKSELVKCCNKKNVKYIEFETFKDIADVIF